MELKPQGMLTIFTRSNLSPLRHRWPAKASFRTAAVRYFRLVRKRRRTSERECPRLSDEAATHK